MSARRAVSIFCDFQRCERREVVKGEHGDVSFAEARARLSSPTRGVRDRWVVEYGPSSCRYDLCPGHRHERPGETFPDWKKPSA